jgi:type II secretory pathway component PulM
MDPMIRWSIRLAQWFRQPPSRGRVILMAVTIGLCLALVLVERLLGWPEWATLGDPGPRILRP